MKRNIYYNLIRILGKNNVECNELLKKHTYTKLGGKADFYITPTNYDMVSEVLKFSHKYSIPLIIIGNGSNLIVRDGGIRGIVMCLKKLNSIIIDNTTLIAQSGANTMAASYRALKAKLSGFEFACGIPGTIGGAIFMNAGAYGGEIKDILSECLIVDKKGEIHHQKVDELELGYRYSNLQENDNIVLAGKFQLQRGEYEKIKAIMDELTYRRKSKQPLEYPSCGSVFKRPNGFYSGKLIQDSGLQGYRIGGAEVSKKHAGFIVNKNNATASDYIRLIEHIQTTVKEKFNVKLEREVKIIGEN